jgi:hypothetical protein
MLVTSETYEGIVNGTTTTFFRKWKTPKYGEGDRLEVRDVVLVVDRITQVPASSLTAADASAAGHDDVDDLLDTLEERGGGRDDPDRLVWRVDFHVDRDAGS